jgi:ferric hydroxamate transport system ATP-binding protein
MPTQALSADLVTVRYGATAVVHHATLDLAPGQVTALVGPNGSGKSTLLRALARLHRPSGGEVRLDEGRPAWSLTARDFARRVSLLTQHSPAPSGLRVHDVVSFGRQPHRGRWGAGDPDGAQAVASAMELTGVATMADRAVDQLSGGELQRVWLATCLAQETGVLLLDEPTNHLDLRYQVEVLELIRELADHHQVTVGVVLHDLGHAAEVADQAVLLHEGRIVAAGRPPEVLTSENLTTVYGITVHVVNDPVTGVLHVRPVGRHVRVA